MIAVEMSVAGGRRARVFSRDANTLPVDVATVAEGAYWDDDDRARDPLLRATLEDRNVRVVAYPTIHRRDVLQVFLRCGGAGRFHRCGLFHRRVGFQFFDPPF